MCFTQNTFCCCKIPLWVGALMIGLNEFFASVAYSEMGLNQEAMVLFGNSVWFALLFIPSLFFNPAYRKTVAIVYSITTGFAILGTLILTIMAAVLGDEIVEAIAYMMDSQDSSIYTRNLQDDYYSYDGMYGGDWE